MYEQKWNDIDIRSVKIRQGKLGKVRRGDQERSTAGHCTAIIIQPLVQMQREL